MNKIPFVATLSAIGLAVSALVACGGGGSATPVAGTLATVASVRVSTYITDNLATEYSQVWVGVLKITAIDAATQAETALFSATSPSVFNLASLASVGQLMSSLSIGAGTYSHVKVTLDDKVQLVSLDGKTTTNATFKGNGEATVIPVKVDFDTAASTQLVLDFNLARFTLDAATGRVVPVIERRVEDKTKPFMREQAELHGAIVSVSATGFVMNDKRLGDGVVVLLATDAVIVDEATHKVLTLADLKAGTVIEAKGLVKAHAVATDPTSVTAAVVRVADAVRDAKPDAPKFAGGEGKITAIAGSVVTVALGEANFLPGAKGNSVDVDTAAAVYTHGAATDLAIGTTVGFRGTLGTDGKLTALFVDVEGAPSKNDRDAHPNLRFADLKATVVSLAGSLLTIDANPREGNANSNSRTYTVDIAKAGFKNWGVQCLTAGQHIDVKGALAGNVMTALVIEIEGACLSAAAATPPAPPASAASGPK